MSENLGTIAFSKTEGGWIILKNFPTPPPTPMQDRVKLRTSWITGKNCRFTASNLKIILENWSKLFLDQVFINKNKNKKKKILLKKCTDFQNKGKLKARQYKQRQNKGNYMKFQKFAIFGKTLQDFFGKNSFYTIQYMLDRVLTTRKLKLHHFFGNQFFKNHTDFPSVYP